MRSMTEQAALSKLAALCSAGEHCRHDVEDKLRRWGLDSAATERVVRRLVEGRYVDDERFCRAYVHDKVRYDRWGRRKIEQQLRMRDIEPAVCRAVLDAVDDELYVDALRPLLLSKRRSLTARNDYELTAKLLRFATGRGYTMDIIRRCMDTTAMDTDE